MFEPSVTFNPLTYSVYFISKLSFHFRAKIKTLIQHKEFIQSLHIHLYGFENRIPCVELKKKTNYANEKELRKKIQLTKNAIV